MILVSFFPLHSFATGQDGDIIYINGEKWELLGRPIFRSGLDKELLATLPEHRNWTTANWDGFIACWSIKNEMLVLDSVLTIDSNRAYSPSAVREVFQKFVNKKQIVATWYTDTVRVVRGKQLLYLHSGFMRHYETEMMVSIHQGRVTDTQTFNNRLMVKGFSPEHLERMSAEERDSLLNIDTSQYPELKDAGRALFQIRHPLFDTSGNFLNCQVKCQVSRAEGQGREEHPALADDFKRLLMNIKPWQIYLINGKYVNGMWDKGGYNIPVMLHKKK